MFGENSAIVQLWLRYLDAGVYTIDQVPSLSNLREVILSLWEG